MLRLSDCPIVAALVMLSGCATGGGAMGTAESAMGGVAMARQASSTFGGMFNGASSEPLMPAHSATQQGYSTTTPSGYGATSSYAAPAPAQQTPGFFGSLMPQERTDTVRYAEQWYACHDGEREAKIIQCQRIADPTHDETCIVALEAQQRDQNAPRGYAVPMLGASNGPSAYCKAHVNSPPPPGY